MQKDHSWQLNENDDELIDLALKEDLQYPFCDITTKTLFQTTSATKTMQIISNDHRNIIICGIPIVNELLSKFDNKFDLITTYQDGDTLAPEQPLLKITSDAQTLLMAERTILNFLRHLCAIATITKQFCDLIQHTPVKILDTRKTTPGLRHLEKYAVACGGGVNHRMGLYDTLMIKDTHIDAIGGIKETLDRLPNDLPNKLPVIVEIRNLSELDIAIKHGHHKITRVLLDNMPPDLLQQCVSLCNNTFETEASGNISLENIVEIAEAGVNYASIGMLTYSAGQVDLSMRTI